jgi:hypothetical protein
VLSASFIPVYARLLAEGEEELAGRVAGIIASLLALSVGILVLIGVICTPWLLVVIAPGFKGDVRDLTIEVVRILFPGIGLLVMSSWCLGVLNSHRKFFLSYVAPVLMNIVMIATLVVFGGRVSDRQLAVWASWGIGRRRRARDQIPFVFQYAKHLRFAMTTLEPVRQVIAQLHADGHRTRRRAAQRVRQPPARRSSGRRQLQRCRTRSSSHCCRSVCSACRWQRGAAPVSGRARIGGRSTPRAIECPGLRQIAFFVIERRRVCCDPA